MERWIKALGVAALIAGSVAQAQEPPITTEVQKLVAFDEGWSCLFGYETSMGNDLAVVASERDRNAGYESGAAYVYRRVADTWVFEAKWIAQNTVSANFGSDTAVMDDRVMVGAKNESVPGYSRGSAYIYHHDGSAWSLEQQLLIPGSEYLRLGDSVDLEVDVAVAGAPSKSNGSVFCGAVYVWRLGPGSWVQEAVLFPSDAIASQEFGATVAVHGDVIAVGSPRATGVHGDSGAVYIFRLIHGVWTETDKLVGALTSGGHFPYRFGNSLDMDGETVAIGSPYYLAENFGAGLVFTYQAVEREWVMDAIVEPSDAQAWGQFGGSLDIEGSRLLVGASGHTCDGVRTGAAYYFERQGQTWFERAKFSSSDRALYDNVGGSVAMSSDWAMVTAFRHSTTQRRSGAAYAFDLPVFAPLGAAYCAGDGSAVPCPCGNDSPVGEDRGCVNSRGVGAWLEASGSASVSTDTLALYARDLPRYQPCLLFAGPDSLGSGSVFGDGLRCVGGTLVRLGVGMGSVMGTAAFSAALDLGSTWLPGDTVRLQGWYRDVAAGSCGTGFNLTNGVELVLTP